MPCDRILFIDAYDSFSNSIIALLSSQLSTPVECIKIDDPRFVLNDEAFHRFLDGFAAAVVGPGPGHPAKAQDVGLISKLWTLPEEHLLPVLGICLGFQSLCLAFGARVERLKEPRHGVLALISHRHEDVFEGTEDKLVATQYHSLHVRLREDCSLLDGGNLWAPSKNCEDLIPLAWDLLNVANGPTLMAVKHRVLPFRGVQYHPESICTNDAGKQIVHNWWNKVREFNEQCRRRHLSKNQDPAEAPESAGIVRISLDAGHPASRVQWISIMPSHTLDVAGMMEVLRGEDQGARPVLLESGTRDGKPVNPETGRFSLIGLHYATSLHARYFTDTSTLEITSGNELISSERMPARQVLAYINELTLARKATGGPPESPFWGGLMGFISYEAGLQTIDVSPPRSGSSRPGLWFVFVERSVVLDHIEGEVYVQSIREGDENWIEETKRQILAATESSGALSSQSEDIAVPLASITHEPDHNVYLDKVHACQSYLRAGSSYELCLTDKTLTDSLEDPWAFYRRLRRQNPAPLSSFIQLHSDATALSIASSSPERFLSWTRAGRCQFRPIKGTVKKDGNMTRTKAEHILASPKERAENLMILDLIRHDLATVTGPNGVYVPKLMAIEEYATVYQLVSVIEGTLPHGTPGVSALAASLPPGSMTGAPKKRSCEILKDLENNTPRGLYSGVIGYLDVGGGGDFSVVIRTAFKWDDAPGTSHAAAPDNGLWQIGAGGAVTVLSEPEAEWEEMLAKRASVLKSFFPSS